MNTLFNDLSNKCVIEEDFKNELDTLNKDWKNVKDKLKNEKSGLKNILENTEQLLRNLKEMKDWLLTLEKEIPSPDKPIETSAQLFQLKAKYQLVRDKCDSRLTDFRTMNTLAKEMHPNDSAKEISKLLSEINDKWNSIATSVQSRVKILQNASNHYGQFRSLAAQQADWLDRLERRLARASPTAVDAEDISEELDVSFDSYLSVTKL